MNTINPQHEAEAARAYRAQANDGLKLPTLANWEGFRDGYVAALEKKANAERSDFDQYQSNLRSMSEKLDALIADETIPLIDLAKRTDSPEFQALWRANEEIKNRHGGMPPKEP